MLYETPSATAARTQRLIKTLPRKGFRFVGAVQEERAPAAAAVAATPMEARSALTVPDKPSIGVLPFANLSSNPEQEYMVDGIVDPAAVLHADRITQSASSLSCAISDAER